MDTKNDIIESKDSWLGVTAFFTVLVILIIWVSTYFVMKDLPQSDRGNFGDMFSTVNSLFSGLAMAGIILTILLQRKELSLQRQELKFTREELKRSATAQENSEIALNRQAENLKISAKLSALNTLVTYYTDLEIQVRNGLPHNLSYHQVNRKKNMFVERIEEILERKEQP